MTIAVSNPDLTVISENKPRWNYPPFRRYGFQNFSKVFRYGLTYRAHSVMQITPDEDRRIGQLPIVQQLTNHPYFNAVCVLKDGKIKFERYAGDFRSDQLHSIQSISKTMVNLLFGNLVASGKVQLDALVTSYIPEVAKGFSGATVQQLLNMDVLNDYSEDFTDYEAMYYDHEHSMGWRLLSDPRHDELQKDFLARIGNSRKTAPSPFVKYQDCNTEVLAWIIERVTKVPMRQHLAAIIDAAGIESQFAMSCDREQVPVMSGGGCFTIRDLVRYGSIFTRGGVGVNGEQIGNKEWISKTLKGGIKWDAEPDHYRYSNHCETDGRAIAHGGYCGQYLYADCTSGTVVGFFSVTDEKDGLCEDHYSQIWKLLNQIARLDG